MSDDAEKFKALAPATDVIDALRRVMADLPNIGKGDRSPEGYQYRGIEAVTKHAQPLFAKHGVVIAPRARITQVVPSPAMKDGWQDVYMEVEWTITGPDGSTITAQTNGIGRDRSDKGANKAQTQAFKYLLLHLLCIADGKDDSDGQTYEHDRDAHPAVDPDKQARIDAAARLRSLTAAQRDSIRAFCDEHDIPRVSAQWTDEQLERVTEQMDALERAAAMRQIGPGEVEGADEPGPASPDSTPEETT